MMQWVSVNQTWLFLGGFFSFLLGSSYTSKASHLDLSKGEAFSGRVVVQLTPRSKFEASGCEQIKIACQCKLLLGLKVCLVVFFVVFFSYMQQSHCLFFFFFLSRPSN